MEGRRSHRHRQPEPGSRPRAARGRADQPPAADAPTQPRPHSGVRLPEANRRWAPTVTAIHLLAMHRGEQLVSFDQRIPLSVVPGAMPRRLVVL